MLTFIDCLNQMKEAIEELPPSVKRADVKWLLDKMEKALKPLEGVIDEKAYFQRLDERTVLIKQMVKVTRTHVHYNVVGSIIKR